ncbi:MAG: ADP-glyceromanno-heptose 6-epimerase [Deltaproteobacteria bacterium]|nr:ADP-glyceromanno-heptose 6-epimerase [Deltaproteobacteria bacterium]
MSTLLITGAAGFIGSCFVEACKEHKILSCDSLEHFKNRTEHSKISFGSIIDREKLLQWLNLARPHLSAIVHLGACTDTTQTDGAYLTKMNVQYSQSLWKYATDEKIPFIYASSAATYGDGQQGYDDERSISSLKPLNPYGQSKQDFDVWALEQEKIGYHPPSWNAFKFFNVYGYGERHKGNMASVVLKAYDQIQAFGFVKLFRSHRPDIADGEQKRDFIFVNDVVDVLKFTLLSVTQMAAAERVHRGIYNLGTGHARSFLDLVTCVFQELNIPRKIEWMATPENIRDQYQYFTQASMGKLHHAGYTKEFTSLEQGIHQYITKLLSRSSRSL